MFRKRNLSSPLTPKERAQRDAERENMRKIEAADGIECDICGNKGLIYFADGDNLCSRDCECKKRRRSLKLLKQSGLEQLIVKMTFDSFVVSEPWQKQIKQQAQSYAADPQGWFYCGGQVGSGKTHLCTAICGELLKKCYSVRYMLWRDESVKLKAAVNSPEYQNMIKPYKECDVLYIDDFFKTQQGQKVTQADVNLAFELINWRYTHNKITIFSSERFAQDIMNIDEGVGSRICEKAKIKIPIKLDQNRNYRLKNNTK